MNQTIYLTGYMASGKSALAKALSSSLDRATVDLDHHVENQWERTIKEGIEQFGELEFRRIERILLRELPTENQILSTGGGTACFYGNMDWMLANGLVFYLKMSPSDLSQRIIADREAGIVRHLVDFVSDEDMTEFVAKHLFERQGFYGQAHHIIDGSLPLEEQVKALMLVLPTDD